MVKRIKEEREKKRASRQFKPNTIIQRPMNEDEPQDIAKKEINVSTTEFKSKPNQNQVTKLVPDHSD